MGGSYVTYRPKEEHSPQLSKHFNNSAKWTSSMKGKIVGVWQVSGPDLFFGECKHSHLCPAALQNTVTAQHRTANKARQRDRGGNVNLPPSCCLDPPPHIVCHAGVA